MAHAGLLNQIFGPDSQGETADERARTSSRLFVRGEDHLAFDSPPATGIRLTAWEALQAFGLSSLEEILEYGNAIIPQQALEPAASLSRRRKFLGLDIEDVARKAGVSKEQVIQAENFNKRSEIRVLTRIAQALQLDDLRLGRNASHEQPASFAWRLKNDFQLQGRNVLALNEAAWVIHKQGELSAWLSSTEAPPSLASMGFTESHDYGDRQRKTWQVGYDLALKTRKLLGLSADAPVESLRQLAEQKLGIPVIQMRLPKEIAGAAVTAGGYRGIVLNTEGDKKNIFIRRVVLAHELGHILWDPPAKFGELPLLRHKVLDGEEGSSPVEARAKAFAANFLAPTQAILDCFDDKDGDLRPVMEHFGINFITAQYHLKNACRPARRQAPEHKVDEYEHTEEWAIRENFIQDLLPPEIPEARRGRFCLLVSQARQQKLISDDSAAACLALKNTDKLEEVCTRILATFAEEGSSPIL